MSAEALRQVAAMSETLRKAADSLAMVASLDNAIRERQAAIAKMDGKLSEQGDEYVRLQTEIALKKDEAARLDREYNDRKDQLDMEVNRSVAERKQHVECMLDEYLNAKRAEAAALDTQVAALANAVSKLAEQREKLHNEVQTAKQRIAAV